MNKFTLKIIGYVESTVKRQMDERWKEAAARVVSAKVPRGIAGCPAFSPEQAEASR